MFLRAKISRPDEGGTLELTPGLKLADRASHAANRRACSAHAASWIPPEPVDQRPWHDDWRGGLPAESKSAEGETGPTRQPRRRLGKRISALSPRGAPLRQARMGAHRMERRKTLKRTKKLSDMLE